jgi:hypothetical protein
VRIFADTTPILQRLNFIDIGDAMGYEYDREASLPGVGFRSLNGNYPEQVEGQIVPVREGTAILGGLVKTDWQMAQNASRKSSRIAAKARAAGLFFTRMFFDGNSQVSAVQFDGLNARIGASKQLMLAGADGGYLDLDAYVQMCDKTIGSDGQKIVHMGLAMRRLLGATIRAAGSAYITMADWSGPLSPTKFNNVGIEPIENDESDAVILNFDEACGAAPNTGSIYCLNYGQTMDEDRFQGLARMAAQGLFVVNEQGVRDTTDQVLVEGRAGLATFHGRSVTRYAGILPAVNPDLPHAYTGEATFDS